MNSWSSCQVQGVEVFGIVETPEAGGSDETCVCGIRGSNRCFVSAGWTGCSYGVMYKPNKHSSSLQRKRILLPQIHVLHVLGACYMFAGYLSKFQPCMSLHPSAACSLVSLQRLHSTFGPVTILVKQSELQTKSFVLTREMTEALSPPRPRYLDRRICSC